MNEGDKTYPVCFVRFVDWHGIGDALPINAHDPLLFFTIFVYLDYSVLLHSH